MHRLHRFAACGFFSDFVFHKLFVSLFCLLMLPTGSSMEPISRMQEKADLLKSADLVIVEGESDECQRSERQLLLRVCAALPGEDLPELYGIVMRIGGRF